MTMTTTREYIETKIMRPLPEGITCRVTTGNAVRPYREVMRATLATELGARMFGCLQCRFADDPEAAYPGQYHYWTLE